MTSLNIKKFSNHQGRRFIRFIDNGFEVIKLCRYVYFITKYFGIFSLALAVFVAEAKYITFKLLQVYLLCLL